MESFGFAETFKYFFLLFATPSTLDFDHCSYICSFHLDLQQPNSMPTAGTSQPSEVQCSAGNP
jgi:hypothetical protein